MIITAQHVLRNKNINGKSVSQINIKTAAKINTHMMWNLLTSHFSHKISHI